MTIPIGAVRDEITVSSDDVGRTVWNYSFKIYSTGDVRAFVLPKLLIDAGEGANDVRDEVDITTYTGIGEQGGTITINPDTPVAENDLLTIVQDIPVERATDYKTNGDFLPVTVNGRDDLMTSLIKQNNDERRGFQFQKSEQSVQDALVGPLVPNGVLTVSADKLNIYSVPPATNETGYIEQVSGDGVNNSIPNHPQITSVVRVRGDRIDRTSETNPYFNGVLYAGEVSVDVAKEIYTFTAIGANRYMPIGDTYSNGIILSFYVAPADVNVGVASITTNLGTYEIKRNGASLSGDELTGWCMVQFEDVASSPTDIWHLLNSNYIEVGTIPDNSITTPKVLDEAITLPKLDDSGVEGTDVVNLLPIMMCRLNLDPASATQPATPLFTSGIYSSYTRVGIGEILIYVVIGLDAVAHCVQATAYYTGNNLIANAVVEDQFTIRVTISNSAGAPKDPTSLNITLWGQNHP